MLNSNTIFMVIIIKKIIIILISLLITIYSTKNSKIYLPQDTIRFRIIANDNSFEGQKLKWDINKELIPIIAKISENSYTIEKTRANIKDNFENINTIISKYTDEYQISYGNNYFPKKEFSNIIYPEGEYESLVISLGDSKGDNWWCIMFPPLCLLEYQKQEYEKVEYDFYIKNIINKYIK